MKLDFGFIDNRENIVFIGPPASVKPTGNSRTKGELKKKINALCKYNLVIIDELGYLPMNKQDNYNLFQLINTL